MRPVWTGTLSFGLVAVPVKLFAATESHAVHFHQLRRGTEERVRHRRVAESSGEEVSREDIVKGYEVEPGEHVVVEPDELETVDPGPERTVDVEEFVPLDQIDPVYFQRTYHLVPAEPGAVRAYRLLHRAMTEAARVAIGRFVLRGRQHLVAVRPTGRVLALETMFFADEVRDPEGLDEVAELDGGPEPADRELAAALQLIGSLAVDWDPERYPDTYREEVLELVHRKAEGEEVVTGEEDEPAPVVDLMEALERSIREAGRGAGGARRQTARSERDEGAGWDGMTRDELYAVAQRRDFRGRSRMSRDELEAALQEAS